METCEQCNGENGHKHYCPRHSDFGKEVEAVGEDHLLIDSPLQYRNKDVPGDRWEDMPSRYEVRRKP